jgi:hypothetical protein
MGMVGHRWYWEQILRYRNQNSSRQCLFHEVRTKTWFEAVFKVSSALLYQIMCQARRLRHLSMSNNNLLYAVSLPASKYSSCSDVPSDSLPMFLQTANMTLSSKTMRHHPMLQYLGVLPYDKQLSSHHLAAFNHNFLGSTGLLPSMTPLPFHFPWQYFFAHLLSSIASCAMTVWV